LLRKKINMIKFSDIFGKDDKEKKEPVSPEPKKEHRQEQGGSKINFFRAFFREEKKEASSPKKEEVKPQAPLSGPVSFPAICKNNEQNQEEKEKKEDASAGKEKKPSLSDIDFFSLFNNQSLSNNAPAGSGVPKKGDGVSGAEAPAPSDIDQMYKQAVIIAQDIFNSDSNLTETQMRQVSDFVENLIDCIKDNDQQFMERVFKNISDDMLFVALHFVNVCVLALELGVGLNYANSQLLRLGIAAFLHDLGLRKYRDLVNQKRKLTPVEIHKLQRHPLDASEIIKVRGGHVTKQIGEIIAQQHERIDGSGYPRGLKNGDISEMAQIIGLVDVYEALTHKRPYRDKYTPIEALKIILEDKDNFSARLTKAFMERIGFYPKGTFVELNTKEAAQVIKQNIEMPSCPVVKIIYDLHGKKNEQSREIDLSRGTKVFITKSL